MKIHVHHNSYSIEYEFVIEWNLFKTFFQPFMEFKFGCVCVFVSAVQPGPLYK